MGKTFTLAVQNQIGIVDEGHSVRCGELLCALADEVDVGTLFQDQAGGLDGVSEAFDASHTASFHAATIHEQGIQLNSSIEGEKAAAAGVEGGIVFKDGDGGFNGVESGAAEGEDVIASFESVANTRFVSGRGLSGNSPCAAVDEEDGRVCGRECHRDMVAQLPWVRD
jgi:hypothetical protein